MDIKVFEIVCCKGSKLGNVLDKALAELEMDDNYEIISDIQSILNRGILATPTLMINEKIYISGTIPTVNQVKEALLKAENNFL